MTLDKCFMCGFCKANCPVFRVLLSETKGPRGRAVLAKRGITDEVFYFCLLCKSCEVECPAGVELAEEIRKMRENLVKSGKETESNRKMIENVRKTGNPFGQLEKGKTPKELFCC